MNCTAFTERMTSLKWASVPQEDAPSRPRTIHINTSGNGGGVAELISSLVDHDLESGLPTRWAVLDAPGPFFDFTKRLHYLFHGKGDPLEIQKSSQLYRAVLRDASKTIIPELRRTDTVVLHDPQTLGLVSLLRPHARRVYWHCHIGATAMQDNVREKLWDFFESDVQAADAVLVADPSYLRGFSPRAIQRIMPAISPTAPKNRDIGAPEVQHRLTEVGLFGSTTGESQAGRIWQHSALPATAPVLLQISRWDPLKGMVDLLSSVRRMDPSIHVVIAGPDPKDVLDDPEGSDQLDQALATYNAMPSHERGRVHIATLSIRDKCLNALRINALQRRADIVVQRSVEEGFGLTVTEAMFKAKPVVAHRVGGLAAQISDGVNGLLTEPRNDKEFVSAVHSLMNNKDYRTSLGSRARRDVRARFLMDRLSLDYQSLSR